MGRLSGHLLPGFFFISFALWWAYNIFFRYYVSRKEAVINGRSRKCLRYKSSLLFPCHTCCNGAPVEAFLIVAATTIGIIGELVTGFRGGQFVNVGNTQHMSMYFFFGLMAFVNILLHYKFSIPPSTDYAVALLAIVNEALLFANHLHGRPPMDVLVHTLLLYPMAASLLCGAIEMAYRCQVLAALGRTYGTILQGTWFCHVGFILYPLPGMRVWDQEDHSQMTVITTLFTVHLAVDLIVLMVIAGIVNLRVRMMDRPSVQRVLKNINVRFMKDSNGSNGDATRAMISESEDEL
ncbi:transmembrane protein 45B isoform X2 [Hyalella azteca]|uniref:Transmembrane protein 45B isoform X2 n=1 Tax=Hyalella azteca TaxID=294128 RepID=A0A979FU79_HYAAZ|nr:transmembrane protein 45B isoform X2 [Hyalella azteca]